MARRGFWTKERMLPGQETGEEVHATYSMLKLFHPPSASALALGAVAGAWLACVIVHQDDESFSVLDLLLVTELEVHAPRQRPEAAA